MRHLFDRLALFLGAAALFTLAVALPPTLIGTQDAHVAEASHSWLAIAFPTGQASFARGDEHKS